MTNIIKNLKNPAFNCKCYYIAFLPLRFLPYSMIIKIRKFAKKHWDKNPAFMHRLYWTMDTNI